MNLQSISSNIFQESDQYNAIAMHFIHYSSKRHIRHFQENTFAMHFFLYYSKTHIRQMYLLCISFTILPKSDQIHEILPRVRLHQCNCYALLLLFFQESDQDNAFRLLFFLRIRLDRCIWHEILVFFQESGQTNVFAMQFFCSASKSHINPMHFFSYSSNRLVRPINLLYIASAILP